MRGLLNEIEEPMNVSIYKSYESVNCVFLYFHY